MSIIKSVRDTAQRHGLSVVEACISSPGSFGQPVSTLNFALRNKIIKYNVKKRREYVMPSMSPTYIIARNRHLLKYVNLANK